MRTWGSHGRIRNLARARVWLLRYFGMVSPTLPSESESLPLHSRTPVEWGRTVLADPVSLLIDHAFLEKKAATNALELLTRWPNDWQDGWVEAMTGVARDEVAHLAQVTRLLLSRGARLDRFHKNPYASSLRQLVRKGEPSELLDRLLVAALIEVRSCERFAVLAVASTDVELASFYGTLSSSELGHYRLFLHLARGFTDRTALEARWQQMLAAEARILAEQDPGPRIHSGFAAPAPGSNGLARRSVVHDHRQKPGTQP
jgi:tRNA-(ms[2]io[6]A)-hydroxylase